MLAVFAALGVIILASSFGTKDSASTEQTAQKPQTTHLWELKAPGINPTIPSNFQRYVGVMPGCEGSEAICVIEAPGTEDDEPDFDQVSGLAADLAAFWNTQTASNISEAVFYKDEN